MFWPLVFAGRLLGMFHILYLNFASFCLTERSDIGVTQGEGLVCGIEKQDDRMTERCGGLQSEVRTERDIMKLLINN
jgi:hypothetical protein